MKWKALLEREVERERERNRAGSGRRWLSSLGIWAPAATSVSSTTSMTTTTTMPPPSGYHGCVRPNLKRKLTKILGEEGSDIDNKKP